LFSTTFTILTYLHQNSTLFYKSGGNGKRDRTPTPSKLRKIKRISFKVFLDLKELFENFKRKTTKAQSSRKKLRPRAYRNNDLAPRIHLSRDKTNTKSKPADRKNSLSQNGYTPVYEPSSIQQTRESSFWRWRRVREINDPIESVRIKNINGHIIT